MRAAARRLAGILPVLILAGVAFAQTSPLEVAGRTYNLGEAALVAGNVAESLWSPDGADLLYVSKSAKGTHVGLYSLKTESGAVALTLAPSEKIEKAVWLNAGHKALIVTRRKLAGREIETDLLTVRVLSVENAASQELWSSEFPTAISAKVELELSPILAHALVKLSFTSSRTMLVLTLGAKSIVPSADLLEVTKHGEELVGWSSSGTALFLLPAATTTTVDGAPVFLNAFYATQRRVPLLSDIPVLGRIFSTAPTSFQEGDPVLECVPSNGVLRPVRFPGFYEKTEESRYPLSLHVEQSELSLGTSAEPVQSLWLVGEGEKPAKKGSLISADAKFGALSPSARSVSFITNGALFVRSIVPM
jgi:hypothetical protein